MNYIKEGILFKVDDSKIYTARLSGGREGAGKTEEDALKSAIGFTVGEVCAHCKEAISGQSRYLNFAGDNLHTYCLIDYMQEIGVLKEVVPDTGERKKGI